MVVLWKHYLDGRRRNDSETERKKHSGCGKGNDSTLDSPETIVCEITIEGEIIITRWYYYLCTCTADVRKPDLFWIV